MQRELKEISNRFLAWSEEDSSVKNWLSEILLLLDAKKLVKQQGNFDHWQKIVKAIQNLGEADSVNLMQTEVSLTKNNISEKEQARLKTLLLKLSPWRKGPFEFFGVKIDSEWQSNKKWDRLEKHLNIKDKKVLDVGCSNGYYAWRCLGLGADLVVGIDPSLLFFNQFLAIKGALKDSIKTSNTDYSLRQKIFHLPMTLEDMPSELEVFDTVLSMGVLYHRQSPMEHLINLNKKLKSGGELFLETLVVDGDETKVLVPQGEYAGMTNVWFLPSVKALKVWLQKVGFKEIEEVDLSYTTTEEQRRTEFMQSLSLENFLNPKQNATKENHPLPQRVIMKCKKY